MNVKNKAKKQSFDCPCAVLLVHEGTIVHLYPWPDSGEGDTAVRAEAPL